MVLVHSCLILSMTAALPLAPIAQSAPPQAPPQQSTPAPQKPEEQTPTVDPGALPVDLDRILREE